MNVDYNTETQEITVELNTPAIEFDTPTGGRGLKGDTGSTGPQGPKGDKGDKGDKGEKGDDGYTPVKGVDYFTAQDIASLNIPTKVSDLTNDTRFITNTVNNLTNYYTSSNTYTKTEVNNLISTVGSLNIEVVQTLPTQDISTSTIYLVPNSSQGTNNYYDEYIYVNNSWELIGSTQVDLSNYYTKTETDTLLSAKADTTDIIPTSNNADYSVGYWNFSSTYISDINTYNTNLMAGEDSVYINSDTQNLPNDLYPLLTSNEIAIIKTYSHKKVYQGKVIAREEIYLPTITNRSWYRNVTRDTSNVKTFGNWYEMANKSDLSSKQDTLVSGTNIKTINNTSLLGSGNIDIQGITTVTGGSIRIWTASPGIYYVPKGTLIYYNGETSNSSDKNDDRDTFLIINEKTNGIVIYYWINGITYERWTYQNSSGALRNMLNAGDLINNLTEQYAGNPLDAKQGKVLKDLIDAIKDGTTIDSFSDVETVLSNKQDTLVSGTNIKTINNQSLLGDGNIDVSGGGSTPTDVRVNGTSITSNNVADIITQGTYNSSTNKIATMSDLPNEVTESTVSGWGFTKNTGTYSKPSGGIPKTDLANAVQTSLGKADTALQSYTETDPVFSASAASGITSSDITNWNNKSTFSGSYNDLTNKPTIPDELSDLSDDSTHRLVTDTEKTTWNNKSNFSGSYNDLTNKPTIPDSTSDLTNDSGFIDNTVSNLTNYTTTTALTTLLDGKVDYNEISTSSFRIWDLDPGFYKVTSSRPLMYYNGASGSGSTRVWDGAIVIIGAVQSTRKTFFVISGGTDASTQERYFNNYVGYTTSTEGVLYETLNTGDVVDNLTSSLSESPLSAKQGKALKDLIDAIVVPTKTSDLTNDSGFITSSYHDSTKQDAITNTNKLDYSLLSNTPTIPTVPTTVSSFTNDAGYITSSALSGYATTSDLSDVQDQVDANSANIISNNGKIGILANLNTTAKTDLVNAINEVKGETNTILDLDEILSITSSTDSVYIELKDLITSEKPFYVKIDDGMGYNLLKAIHSAYNYAENYIVFGYQSGGYIQTVSLSRAGTNVTVTETTHSTTDAKINGNLVDNIVTNTAYNSSTNPLATMADISGVPDTGWVNLTPTKGTWDYLKYRVIGNVVYIKGYATAYTWSGSGGENFCTTMPTQYCPSDDNINTNGNSSGRRISRIYITPNGQIGLDYICVIDNGSLVTSQTWIRFNVSYPLDN